jgi:hypothetical protein
MNNNKSKRTKLIELVKGKTLLREAPTRRDVILHVYGIDISHSLSVIGQKKKKVQKIMSHEQLHHSAILFFANKKLNALLRSVRESEQKALEKQGKDLSILHDNNSCQFYMVKDEFTDIWHCVHIINSINGDYLLKHNKAQTKHIETSERRTKNMMEIVSLSEKERDALRKQEFQRRWMDNFKKECTPKYIRTQIVELRKNGKLPQNKKDYRPNIKGIQYEFIKNASEVKTIVAMTQRGEHIDAHVPTYLNPDDIIYGSSGGGNGMLKEIILCDYNKQDYHLPEPKEPDYLGVLPTKK